LDNSYEGKKEETKIRYEYRDFYWYNDQVTAIRRSMRFAFTFSETYLLEIIYLLREYDHEMSENSHKIDKEIQRVHDKVPAAHIILLDDQLGIVNDEAANGEQSQIQVRLIDEGRAQKQIGKGEQDHYVQHAYQSATEIQPTSAFSQERGDAEGDENNRCSCNRIASLHEYIFILLYIFLSASESSLGRFSSRRIALKDHAEREWKTRLTDQSRYHYARVYADHQFEQRTQTETGQEGESQ